MEWQERFNESIEYIESYIEKHPDENMSNNSVTEGAARIAGNSCYDYQRMFSNIVGVPPGEYIRCRRLTLAAMDLQGGILRVTDVALKYGYESLEAFSRAFKLLHGVSPSGVNGIKIQPYPRISVQWRVNEEANYDCLIMEKEAFEMFGVSGLICKGVEGAFSDVPSFWTACAEDGTLDHLNELLGRPRNACLHAAVYGNTQDSFRYMICMHAPELKDIPDENLLSVPAGTWAIFKVQSDDVMPVWRYIYGQWFPDSGYEHAPGPGFEMYYGYASHGCALAEIWVPICRKQ